MSTRILTGFVTVALLAAAGFAFADEQPATPTVPPSPPATGAAPDVPAAPAAAAEDPSDPNKIICKRQSMTGTRLGNYRICLTRKEWDEAARDTSREVQEQQSKIGSPHAGSGSASP